MCKKGYFLLCCFMDTEELEFWTFLRVKYFQKMEAKFEQLSYLCKLFLKMLAQEIFQP